MIKVTSLNARIRKAHEKFGKDSQVYQSYVHRIVANFPENTYHYVNSVIQMKGLKQDDLNVVVGKTGENKTLEFAAISRIPTTKELLKRGKQTYKDVMKERGDKIKKRITEEDAIEWYKWKEDLIEYIDNNVDFVYDYQNTYLDKANQLLSISGRRKTYAELEAIRDNIKRGVESDYVPRKIEL